MVQYEGLGGDINRLVGQYRADRMQALPTLEEPNQRGVPVNSITDPHADQVAAESLPRAEVEKKYGEFVYDALQHAVRKAADKARIQGFEEGFHAHADLIENALAQEFEYDKGFLRERLQSVLQTAHIKTAHTDWREDGS